MQLIGRRVRDLSHLQDEQRSETPPSPSSAKVELTSRCNFQCDYCAHTQHKRPSKDMDRGTYTRVIGQLREAGVTQLGVFFLGESFLVDWLPDAIAEAKRAGFERVFLTTNGSVSTPSVVADCMGAGLDSLKFSLNYSDVDQMCAVAGVKRAVFDQVDNNVRDVYEARKELGFNCHLAGSYIAYDGDQGERMESRIARLSPFLDEIYQLPLYSQAGQVNKAEGRQEWVGNPGHVCDPVSPVPCWVLFSQAHVTYDGKLTACCFDHGGDFDMGSLLKDSFADVWHCDAFRTLRRAHLANDVRGTVCEPCIHR